MSKLVSFFTSLKLTVVCLTMALVLVFVGTLAQVKLGLYAAQQNYFQSLFVFYSPAGSDFKMPVWPGGYLLGTVLLINLIASHIKRFKFSKKKIGIVMVHAGLILLLLGQFFTEVYQVESHMRLEEGQSKNYSESDRRTELVFTDTTNPEYDEVVAIPHARLNEGKTVETKHLPFSIEVKHFFPNARLSNREAGDSAPLVANQGVGPQVKVQEVPQETQMDRRDVPAAIVELKADGKSLGTWLAAVELAAPQTFSVDGRTYTIELRWTRYYKPHTIKLLDFTHERYIGTEIPKDFSSKITLMDPERGLKQERLIYMNNPLRYGGETFYQASFEPGDRVSILQVVRNPAWLTPYASVTIVGLGLTVQFLMHLASFIRRKTT